MFNHPFGEIIVMSLIVTLRFGKVFAVIDNQPCIDAMTDGCSAPVELRRRNVYIRDTFEPACNRHDVCYECGKELGWSRHDCDGAFLKHMQEICNNVYQTKRSAQLLETLSSAATHAKKNFSTVASIAANQAKNTLSTAVNQAKDTLSTKADEAKGTLSTAATIAKDSLSTVANQAKDTLLNVASHAKDTLSTAANQAKDTLSTTATQAKDSLANVANHAKDTLSSTASHAKDTLSTAVNQAKDTVSTAATLTSYIATWITKPKNTLEDCMHAAKIVHFVVEKFGDEHFKPSPGNDVKEVCYMPCTSNYGNPDF